MSLNDEIAYSTAYFLHNVTTNVSAPSGHVSFHNKCLNTSAQQLDSLSFHWLNSEASGYDEDSIIISRLNGTNWTEVPNQTVDTNTNTVTVTNFSLSDSSTTFCLFAVEGGEEEDDNVGSQSNEQLSLDVDTGETNIATVTSEGDPVENAKIFVDGVLICYTDSSGQCEFEACGDTVVMLAMKTGYDDSDELTVTYEDCAEETGCQSNEDCQSDEICSNGECVPVECSCGIVDNHECTAYECCEDLECDEGMVCSDNTCEVEIEAECEADSDCDETEYCSSGSCAEVTGDCGYVSNHAFVGYECGSEEGCSSCADGICIDHECVSHDVSCSNGVVGSTSNCMATQGSGACANCDYVVTAPDGTELTGTTDANGNFNLPLNLVGTYTVSLVESGKSVQVTATQVDDGDGGAKPVVTSDASAQLIFLFVIILLIIGFGAYWYTTRGKKN
jgi:hypothetical protein